MVVRIEGRTVLTLAQGQDLCRRRIFRAKLRPSNHQAPAFIKQIASLVGRLDFVRHHMRQRGFDDLSREIRELGRPGPERRTKTMGSDFTAFHAAQNHQQGHVGQLRTTAARKDKWVLPNGLHFLQY